MQILQKILLFNSIIYLLNVCYSQPSGLVNIEDSYKAGSGNSSIKLFLSLGAGASAIKPTFVLSPNIIVDLHEHFNIATGMDFYFKSKEYGNFVSYNLIPYYVIRSSDLTFLRFGLGGALFNRNNFSPIISIRFYNKIYKNNYLGFEFKSLVPVPFPIESSSIPPLFCIIANYAIRLP